MANIKFKPIFDTPPEADVEAHLDAEAEADLAVGLVVSHDRVRIWLQQLARGEKVPPPEA